MVPWFSLVKQIIFNFKDQKMMQAKNQTNLDEQTWVCLAKDVCPNCGTHDLMVENKPNFTAILTCPGCLAQYQMSAIRSRGVKQISPPLSFLEKVSVY